MDTTALNNFTNRLDHWTEFFGITQDVLGYRVVFDSESCDVDSACVFTDDSVVITVSSEFLECDDDKKELMAFALAATMVSYAISSASIDGFSARLAENAEEEERYASVVKCLNKRIVAILSVAVFPVMKHNEVYDKFMQEINKQCKI